MASSTCLVPEDNETTIKPSEVINAGINNRQYKDKDFHLHFQSTPLQSAWNEKDRKVETKKPIHRHISVFKLSVLGLFCLGFASLFASNLQPTAQNIGNFFSQELSGFYSITVNFYVFVCLLLVVSPLGKIKLAADQNQKPEFGHLSWLAMLFSAGMGVGLFFYGVVEPLAHKNFTFPIASDSRTSLNLTMLHWGIHPWSCYGIVGLSFAYFAFCKNRPFTLRSCLFSPNGILARCIETAAVICPVVGVATSLGLGALQITKGLDHSFGIPSSLTTQIIVILTITLLSTLSVISGVKKGMKFLSNLNMILAFILLLCLACLVSPVDTIVGAFEDLTYYLSSMPDTIIWAAHHNYIQDGNPINWTTFHWSAWIAWAPFVGMFIAKISKGRTIREFLLGVILVPTLLSVFWFSLLGRSSIDYFATQTESIKQILQHNVATTFFVYLGQFSGNLLLYGLAIICLKLFFITSSDSATLVIATSAAEGYPPSKGAKIFWSVTISALAIIFLISGGLVPMQLVTIISALPFAVLSMFMVVYLFFHLLQDSKTFKN